MSAIASNDLAYFMQNKSVKRFKYILHASMQLYLKFMIMINF